MIVHVVTMRDHDDDSVRVTSVHDTPDSANAWVEQAEAMAAKHGGTNRTYEVHKHRVNSVNGRAIPNMGEMFVWAVVRRNAEGDALHGIHSTQEAAQAEAAELRAKHTDLFTNVCLLQRSVKVTP